MLKPSIDTLLDKVPSKYSLVILEAKRAHELESGASPTQEFQSVKSTLRALEEIESGNVVIQIQKPSAKRFVAESKQNACVKKKKSVKLKNKSQKKKKMGKKFKVGFAQSYFLLFSTRAGRRWRHACTSHR